MVARQKDKKLKTLERDNPILARAIWASQCDVHAYLNKRIGQVKIAGKVRFVDMEDDPLAFYIKADMATILGHLTVLDSRGEEVPAFRWWLATADRRQFTELVFEPDMKRVRPGALNECTGFKIAPKAKANGCSILYDHMLRNLCQGDEVSFNWLMDWCAHLFQRPGVKIGVAPILFGQKGSGKSLFTGILAECIGPKYAPVIDNPESLTGKFNAHLARALLIRVEEAIHAKDPRHTSRLNNLITGDRMLVENKGVDSYEIDSKSNLIFSTNMAHSVPASGDERRYFALTCGNDNRQDADFFKGLLAQMRAGGYAAFVHDLMKRDISKTDFSRPPVTPLLSTQIVASMTGLERWWCAALAVGALPFVKIPEDATEGDLEWPEAGPWEVPKGLVQESATAFSRDYQGPPTPEAVGKFLSTNVPGVQQGRRQAQHERQRVYVMPSLSDCRAAFVASRPGLLLEHVTDTIPTLKSNPSGHPSVSNEADSKVVHMRAANAA